MGVQGCAVYVGCRDGDAEMLCGCGVQGFNTNTGMQRWGCGDGGAGMGVQGCSVDVGCKDVGAWIQYRYQDAKMRLQGWGCREGGAGIQYRSGDAEMGLQGHGAHSGEQRGDEGTRCSSGGTGMCQRGVGQARCGCAGVSVHICREVRVHVFTAMPSHTRVQGCAWPCMSCAAVCLSVCRAGPCVRARRRGEGSPGRPR